MSNVKLAIPLYWRPDCVGRPVYVAPEYVEMLDEGTMVDSKFNVVEERPDYRVVFLASGKALYTKMSIDLLCDLLGWAPFTEEPRGED